MYSWIQYTDDNLHQIYKTSSLQKRHASRNGRYKIIAKNDSERILSEILENHCAQIPKIHLSLDGSNGVRLTMEDLTTSTKIIMESTIIDNVDESQKNICFESFEADSLMAESFNLCDNYLSDSYLLNLSSLSKLDINISNTEDSVQPDSSQMGEIISTNDNGLENTVFEFVLNEKTGVLHALTDKRESNNSDSKNDPDYVPQSDEDERTHSDSYDLTCILQADKLRINVQNDYNDTENIPHSKQDSKKTISHLIKKNNSLLDNINTKTTYNKDVINIAEINKGSVGEAMKNPNHKIIDSSCDGAKVYSCYFCKRSIRGKITDHWYRVHKTEPEIKEILSLPPALRVKNQVLSEPQKLRENLISKLRKEGNYKNVIKASLTDTCTTVRRNQKNKPLKHLDNWRICPGCHGMYIKTSIRKHMPSCIGIKHNTGHQTLAMHNLVIGDIHVKASHYLRKVTCRLSNDEVSRVARHDNLIILFGNLEAFKFRHSNHHNKQIRAQMRLLARLLIELKTNNKEITELSDLFDPKHITSYFETVNILGNFNLDKDLFDTPATARDVGLLTAAACNIWLGDCIESHEDRKQELAKKFQHLFNLRFPKLIGKTVSESQTNIEINRGLPTLPSQSDIKKFRNYLIDKRNKAFEHLKRIFDARVWKELVETTLISILLLNRRRPGELERMKLEHYANSFEKITNDTNPQLYNKLTSAAKNLAKRYCRILLRGKKNSKIVPVLLDEKMKECVDLILQYRIEANVSKKNPYLFAFPDSQGEFNWARACPLMKKFSDECGASIPHSLRGTLLRKHIATVGMSLNLTDGEIEDLSKFMGHDKPIHLNIYRQPIATKDILTVSQWLEKAQGSFAEKDGQNIIYEDSCSEAESEDEVISNIHTKQAKLNDTHHASNHHNTPPRNPGTKMPWDQNSSRLVLEKFGERSNNNEKIPGSEIQEFINITPCLKNRRKVAQIRSFLQFKKKGKENKDEKTQDVVESMNGSLIRTKRKISDSPNNLIRKRNRLDTSIYANFMSFIDKKIIPNISEILQVYNQSPSLHKYSPHDLQNLIKKAINFDNTEFDNSI